MLVLLAKRHYILPYTSSRRVREVEQERRLVRSSWALCLLVDWAAAAARGKILYVLSFDQFRCVQTSFDVSNPPIMMLYGQLGHCRRLRRLSRKLSPRPC